MEARDVAAAVMTVVLVTAGVMLAHVIMNQLGDLLSPAERSQGRRGVV